jgi:hypothetical protein
MCNCGKGRRAAISGIGFQGGSGGLPVARAVPPTTVAPMPKVASQQPRTRGVIPIRRAAPVASQLPQQTPAPVMQTVAQQPPMRTRGGVQASAGHGIDTSIWGPSAWYILHTLTELATRSATETGDDRLATHWASFVEAVAISIPCPTCARHFRAWMKWVPFETAVPATTVRGRFAELHNMVNRTNRVPEWSGDLSATYTGSADDVRARITTMRGILGDAMLNAATTMLNILTA